MEQHRNVHSPPGTERRKWLGPLARRRGGMAIRIAHGGNSDRAPQPARTCFLRNLTMRGIACRTSSALKRPGS